MSSIKQCCLDLKMGTQGFLTWKLSHTIHWAVALNFCFTVWREQCSIISLTGGFGTQGGTNCYTSALLALLLESQHGITSDWIV